MPPKRIQGWESSVPAVLAPEQPLHLLVPGTCSPAPATNPSPSPGSGEGAAPAQQHRQVVIGKMCWKEVLNKRDRTRSRERFPLQLVFPTVIKTSISAPAQAMSGRETREGVAAGSVPQEHDRATLVLPTSLPAALKHQGGERRGTGLRGRGRLD